MPVTLTYPGVYIEEVPSGVRTISGVPTSITAFVGRARRGPVDEPVTISGFADFERRFGSLWTESTMSYAVRDYFVNGGGQAIIVRVVNAAAAARITLPTASVEAGNTELPLVASSPGSWGNNLRVAVDQDVGTPGPGEPPNTDRFNLVVREVVNNQVVNVERLLNLSVDPASRRYVPRVLAQTSELVRVATDNDGDPIVPNVRPRLPNPGDPPEVSGVDGDDGDALTEAQFTGAGTAANKRGLFALDKTDLFNLLCLPPLTRDDDMPPGVYQAALTYCVRRRAMLIVDPPRDWSADAANALTDATVNGVFSDLGLAGTDARNAALYFPRVLEADPLLGGELVPSAPSGAVAGAIARVDTQRGVWKAPAGIDAALNGIRGLEVNLTDDENGQLNPRGVNCLRSFPITGRVIWGARTMNGADLRGDEYKYIPVRRLALYIEESLYRGTQWVVFEPNDEPLWAQIRLNVGAFMQNLFRQGAFQGTSPRDAYFVKCDKETTTQNDINLGRVNILVGFAPLKPAEFVVIRIQQLAGQVAA